MSARSGAEEYNSVVLEEAFVFTPEKSVELLRLDESLRRLAELDFRQARVVELRFFGDVIVEENG